MNYVLSTLACAATIVGIFGNTATNGLPTTVGWVTLAVAVAVLAVSVIRTHLERRERHEVAALGVQQVLLSVWGFLFPYVAMLADVTAIRAANGEIPPKSANLRKKQFKSFVGARPDEIHLRMESVLEVLRELPLASAFLRRSSFGDSASVLGKGKHSWRYIFSSTSVKALEDLDLTLSAYRSAMNKAEIQCAQRLRDLWLVQRLRQLDNIRDTASLANAFALVEEDHFEELVDAATDVCRMDARRRSTLVDVSAGRKSNAD